MFSFSQQEVKIGMTLDEVKNLLPAAKSAEYEQRITLSLSATLCGLKSEWGYRFDKNNKLDWIFFHKYLDEINSENFTNFLNATKCLASSYTEKYGRPDSVVKGDTNFVDPYKKHHWGYHVLEYYWKNAVGQKICIEFNFMGGKGEYHFLFSVNIFDEKYPYYN